jgi:hypothetical protein
MVCLHMILPRIEQTKIASPKRCASRTCKGTHFRLHQQVAKPLRDRANLGIVVHRYRCLTCGHTFRIYPHGVTHAHTSLRIRELAALLYQLGLSYGAISNALEAWKIYLCKSQVYRAIRAEERDLASSRSHVFQGVRAQPNACYPLLIQVQDSWAPAVLMVDHANRLVLTLQLPSWEAAEQSRMSVMASAAAKEIEIRLTGSPEERKQLGIESSACQDTDTHYHQTSNAHAR